ncbi:MAG TPA: AsnC family protein, partial [Amycolatopsis sp.]|uniref:AsnC family transcriptional regulator n=1 Tax=Amycolatopsis sp. TaxID=37632 RepID=UPI002BAB307C|nr:AsnC family protein [Amycolatopsis sp.]
MAVTDPVDARLLAALAELGKAAVHELAVRVGMDPREVAYRLVALSGSGLPLLVGVESDPNGLRAALAGAGGWARPAPYPPGQPYPVRGGPSGPYPGAWGLASGGGLGAGQPEGTVQGVPSGPYQVNPAGPPLGYGTSSNRYPAPPARPPAPPPRPL